MYAVFASSLQNESFEAFRQCAISLLIIHSPLIVSLKVFLNFFKPVKEEIFHEILF